MYPRIYKSLKDKSFFVFGPRGTGKSTWLKSQYPGVPIIDLLNSESYRLLLSSPHRLEGMIPPTNKLVIIDEIQKIPELLDEVHRLIEDKKINFILTGSSSRKLKRHGVNLLAGRARSKNFYPLTCWELGKDFNLLKALQYGMLPTVWTEDDPKEYLSSYVRTYLKEEVQAEGLVRNLSAYAHFLETATFSQGSTLTMARIATDVGVDAKVVASYFDITEDLLLSYRLPVFSKKAKRRLVSHPKFFYFDVGVYRSIRPKGPLDQDSEIDGVALETLFLQHYLPLIESLGWDQKLFYWKTANKIEVDFVSYGAEGLSAFEIKRSGTLRGEDLEGLKLFKEDYPMAKCYLLNLSSEMKTIDGIQVVPFEKALWDLKNLLVPSP